MSSNNTRLSLHFAACAAATATACLSNADVMYSGVVNLTIPANIDGLYVNVETGATGSTGGTTAGWDINPYGSTGLSFYAASGTGHMRHPSATTTAKTNLPIDTPINSGAYFYGSSAAVIGTLPGQWAFNTEGIVGFKFLASDGLTHYGWARIAIGASLTTRTLVDYAWESVAGVSIAAGYSGSGGPPNYDPCAGFNPQAQLFSNNLAFNSATAADLATCGGMIYKANFYKLTAVTDGEFAFETCPTDSDLKLAILSACDSSAVTLACGASSCANGARATIQATSGAVYYVVIGGAADSTTYGSTVPLQVTPPGLATCETAPVAVYGANAFSTVSYAPNQLLTQSATGATGTSYKVTWFRFTPPVTGLYEFDVCGSVNDTKLAIAYSCPGDAATAFASLAYNDDACACASGCAGAYSSRLFATNSGIPLSSDLQAGTPIYIVIGSYANTYTVSGTLTIIGPPPPACPADFNGDGIRDGLDMTVILSNWGDIGGDVNGDGTTDGLDMTVLLSGWGNCP